MEKSVIQTKKNKENWRKNTIFHNLTNIVYKNNIELMQV